VADGPDPYKILQVDPEAEDEVIQAAYRRLAQKYHPDRATGDEAVARMVALNAAWELIGEPDRRAAYDLALRDRRSASSGRGPARADAGGATAGATGSSRPPGTPGGAGRDHTRGQWTGQQPRPGSPPPATPPAETVSTEWTSGRSTTGSGYDAATMRAPEGLGAAGPPPGNASGSVLNFGRYAGWSLGEIARADLEYIEWLDRVPIGRPYRDEIDPILRRAGRRKSAATEANERRGLFRRR
jgi:curved DNA-binding protein CbpA